MTRSDCIEPGHLPLRARSESQKDTSEALIERAAEAMWELLADRQDDEMRSVCRLGPLVAPIKPWRAQRWADASGVWRAEMLDMARAALTVGVVATPGQMALDGSDR